MVFLGILVCHALSQRHCPKRFDQLSIQSDTQAMSKEIQLHWVVYFDLALIRVWHLCLSTHSVTHWGLASNRKCLQSVCWQDRLPVFWMRLYSADPCRHFFQVSVWQPDEERRGLHTKAASVYVSLWTANQAHMLISLLPAWPFLFGVENWRCSDGPRSQKPDEGMSERSRDRLKYKNMSLQSTARNCGLFFKRLSSFVELCLPHLWLLHDLSFPFFNSSSLHLWVRWD